MNDTWIMLSRYKVLSERVNELRLRAWMEANDSEEFQTVIDEAELELSKLKAWIDLNTQAQKLD